MREIALDTETTGFEPREGHRMVEIGCVEMFNRVRTGKFLHLYLNPERDVPEEAFRVHGLSTEFLKDKPLFSAVAQQFVDFIADSPLVIHNAAFDMKFINAELAGCGQGEIGNDRVVDTLLIARRKYPGAPASLDALCKRFEIDLSKRSLHGALLDSELLAEVYLELLGGRQDSLLRHDEAASAATGNMAMIKHDYSGLDRSNMRLGAGEAELAAHGSFLKKIKEPIWSEYIDLN